MNTQYKVLAVLVVGIVIALLLLILSNERASISSHMFDRSSLTPHRRRPVSVADVSLIAPWMTFDYINELFSLPPDYLQTEIPVHDPRYPILTIKQYAKRTNASTTMLVKEIQMHVKDRVIVNTK